MKEINKLIREYRKSKGLTQIYVAKATGIDNKRLSHIETGRLELKADEFLMLCEKGLKIDPSYFTKKLLEIES